MKFIIKRMSISVCSILILLATYSSTIQSNTFLMKSYVGVINIQQIHIKTSSNIGVRSTPDTYLLHTTLDKKPFKLIFKNGQPNNPLMTGDKVEVVGLNAAGKLFVQKIESLRNNSLPF